MAFVCDFIFYQPGAPRIHGFGHLICPAMPVLYKELAAGSVHYS